CTPTPYTLSTAPSPSCFFLTDPAPPATSPLSLHDALPISGSRPRPRRTSSPASPSARSTPSGASARPIPPSPDAASRSRRGSSRSEEHTSELQSLTNLVCRLLLEKKKQTHESHTTHATPRT